MYKILFKKNWHETKFHASSLIDIIDLEVKSAFGIEIAILEVLVHEYVGIGTFGEAVFEKDAAFLSLVGYKCYGGVFGGIFTSKH